MRLFSRGILVAAALAAGADGAKAETLAEAFAKAYEGNPSLLAARSELRSIDEGVPAARAGMRPNVAATATVGVTESQINGPPQGGTTEPRSIGVNASQILYDGGRTWNNIDSAVSAVDAARASLVNLEQSVLLQTVTSYMNVRRDQQFVSLAEGNVRLITEQLRAAEDRFEVGEVTRTDVSQARARLAQAQAALASQRGALGRSFQAYRRVVGAAPGPLAAPPPLPPLPETLAEAVQQAMDGHPAIRAARFTEEAARSDIAAAQGALLPTIELSTSLQYSEEGSLNLSNGVTSAQVQLQARIPLYQGGSAYANIRRAQAVQSQRMSQIHDQTRTIREAAENAWTDLETARSQIRSGRQQVEAARLAFEGVREEAKLGARTTLDVLDAEQELLNARTNLVASLRDEYVAGFSLLSAIGVLTVDTVNPDVAVYDPTANYADVNEKYFGFSRDELTVWRNGVSP